MIRIIYTLIACLWVLISQAQNYSIILGRPTDTCITASVLFDKDVSYYYEYGTQSGQYTKQTSTFTASAQVAVENDIYNLIPNTRYLYRLRYKLNGAATYLMSPEYHFQTQRSPGNAFTFTIEADEHLYDKKGCENMYRVTLQNQLADQPDFMLSLGDIFGDDHYPLTITSAQLDSLHRAYRPFLGNICHSVPFYICLGNHEGENDYYQAINPPNNLCYWATQARKYYYPNPFPNRFYSGNTTVEPFGIGNPENYYAWTWGDALFVVLDVYRDECDTSPKPKNWSWTLGLPQYTWLKNTLESSTSKYKFVFAHHIRGQGRGGIQEAQLFEWGGLQTLGGNNTFSQNRPGWAKPIHQLFIDNHVSAFFQGHDHLFAHEILDGVTYQEVPMAADSTYKIGILANAAAYVSDTIDGTGHIRVRVSPDCVQVDYVKAFLPADTSINGNHNREIAFHYTIGNCSASGIAPVLNKPNCSVFPNPASDKISIRGPQNDPITQVTMYDLTGSIILEQNTNEINTENIPNGLYFIQINTKSGMDVHRVIISK